MRFKYRNKLSIPFLVGLWGLFSSILYTGLVILAWFHGFPKKIDQRIYFIIISLGCLLTIISSPAVMLKWNWGRKVLSLGFLLILLDLTIFTLSSPMEEMMGMILAFISPIIPVLLLLNSDNFIKYFSIDEKKYNE